MILQWLETAGAATSALSEEQLGLWPSRDHESTRESS